MNTKDIKKTFANIQSQFQSDDKAREEIIILSRSILKPAKLAIYTIHRNNMPEAKRILDETMKIVTKAAHIQSDDTDKEVGSLKSALEEFVEAYAYYEFVINKQIITPEFFTNIHIPHQTYLCALCDFTGELSRRAISLATEKKESEIKEIHQTISILYELFLGFDFRNSELRKKFEGIKYSLHKVEGILYDLSFKQKGE